MDIVTQNKITQLFYRNRDLFRKGNSVGIAVLPNGKVTGTDYKSQQEALNKVHKFHWTWSRCYVMAQFVFYYLGGYESDWVLKCIKEIPFEVKGVKGSTSHWFVQNSKDDRIIDLSKEQFTGLLNIDQWYDKGKRANLGFPFFYKNGRTGKVSINGKCVPSKECLSFYRIWRETEKNASFERYYETFMSTRV